MFNFYEIFAGYDKVADAGRATTCRRKINPRDYKHPAITPRKVKFTKTEGPFGNMGFNGETV